jgi:transcriptional regulator GlxA family with amidase domain
MDRHYAEPLAIRQLARLAGLSVHHFIRAVRAATGQTPHRYLRARRIDRARELLVRTPMPVTEICDAVGFQSLGVLQRAVPPAAVREKRNRGTGTLRLLSL